MLHVSAYVAKTHICRYMYIDIDIDMYVPEHMYNIYIYIYISELKRFFLKFIRL
jgi:hypothetical protein